MTAPTHRKSDKQRQARAAFERDRAEAHTRFPIVFPLNGADRQPLAIGIHKPFREAFPEWGRHRVHRFLHTWTRRWRYLAALVAPGAMRVNLDGSPAGLVDAVVREKVQGALDARQARLGVVTPKRGDAKDLSHAPAGRQRGADRHSPAG